jgi:hypothetical protein
MADTAISTSGSPEWYNNYVSELASAARALGQEEYQPYQGPRVADFTNEQQEAFARRRDALDMWRPYTQQGLDALAAGQGGLNAMAQMTQQAGTFDRPYYEGQFWDVYQPTVQNLQDTATRIGQQQFEDTTLKQLNDNFVGAGQFGSGRHQILGADAAAKAQAEIENKRAQIEMGGRQGAMGDYLNWARQQGSMGGQMGQFAGNQARMGTDLMNFGLGTQTAAMNDANALYSMGQTQQQQNQQNLNLAYQDFQEQQQYPWQQLQNMGNIARGSNITTSSQVQLPSVGSMYQPSTNPWSAGISGGLGTWGLTSAFGGGS